MANNPDTERAFKWAKELSEKISKAQDRLNKLFDTQLAREIPQAIQENDDVIIKLKRQSLQNAIHAMEENLEDTLRAVDWLETVNADDDFCSTHGDEIETVTTVVADARVKLTRQIEAARKLEIAANKGLESSVVSKEAAERDFDEIELRINNEKKYLPTVLRKAEEAQDKAQQAVEARDAKSLADAQQTMNDLGVDTMVTYHQYQDFENRINAFLKKTQQQGLEEDLMSQFNQGTRKLLAINQENANTLKRLTDLGKSVKECKIGEFDVKKVIKVVHLDLRLQPKIEPVLAKVLKGPTKDLERGLDGIARQFKLPTPGKQMLAALQKAGDSVFK